MLAALPTAHSPTTTWTSWMAVRIALAYLLHTGKEESPSLDLFSLEKAFPTCLVPSRNFFDPSIISGLFLARRQAIPPQAFIKHRQCSKQWSGFSKACWALNPAPTRRLPDTVLPKERLPFPIPHRFFWLPRAATGYSSSKDTSWWGSDTLAFDADPLLSPWLSTDMNSCAGNKDDIGNASDQKPGDFWCSSQAAPSLPIPAVSKTENGVKSEVIPGTFRTFG